MKNETIAERIIRDVSELPDRSSPEDWPEAMLVTSHELQSIVLSRLEYDTYYLASLKLQGWFSQSSQFTSDISQAKPFTREAALEQARRYKSNAHILVPVRASDMEAI